MTVIAGTDPIRSPSADRQSQRPPLAVLMSRFPSVTETFILREMIEMERQGQRICLVPMLKESPPVIHDEALPWTERALYTPYFSLSIAAANLRAAARRPRRYFTLLARLAVETILSPSIFVRTLAVFPKSVLLAESLERAGVGHVHAHFATHPATMALIIGTLSGIPFSFTVHAHDIFVNRRLLRWKIERARFIRSISEFNRRYLMERYPREAGSKICVVHMGLDPGVYERLSRERTVAGPPPRILCVAAYKPYKGIPVLIEACRILRAEGVDLRCDVLGHGPMEAELRQLVDRSGLKGIVEIAGPRPQDEVGRMMAEAALFVLPSTIAADGQMEGIPVALMEAMAAGRPAISTAISGIPELIEDNVSGLLVPPGDAKALAGAIRSVLRNPEQAREMGQRGAAKIRSEFDVRWCVRRLLGRLAEAERREA